MKGPERPCYIKPQLRSSRNVLQRSVEPAANSVIWHRSKTGRYSITSSARASSVGTARGSSITRLLLRSHHPDAAHLALLNEVNKSDVGLVECIVSHWGASLSGFFTQQLIHCQSFLQNWSPFFRQILCRNHSKANAFNETAIFADRPKRLNSHSFPHQLRISSGKRLISYPICECQSAICPQNTKSFGNRSLHIRNVAKCFLADDSVDARVRKRHVHHVSLDNPRSTVKANASG